jgi:hypothetical protein
MKLLLAKLKIILKLCVNLYFSPKIIYSKLTYRNPRNPQINSIVKELRKDGIAYVKNFYSREQINQIYQELVPEVDKLDHFRDNCIQDGVVWLESDKSKMVQKNYGYSRLLDISKYGKASKSHAQNKFFREVASAYYGRECNSSQSIIQKSVAPDNPVGLDYHLDGILPRFKTFLYLHDVSKEHGPFSLVKGTQRMSWFRARKLINMAIGDATKESIIQPDEMNLHVKGKFKEEIAVANAGTLIFADVNSIHRGILTHKGFERYAVAVYFSPKD